MRQKIINYLKEHPDSTTDDIAHSLLLDWIRIEIILEDIANESYDVLKGYIWELKEEFK